MAPSHLARVLFFISLSSHLRPYRFFNTHFLTSNIVCIKKNLLFCRLITYVSVIPNRNVTAYRFLASENELIKQYYSMTKRFPALLGATAVAAAVWASPLTPEQALQRAASTNGPAKVAAMAKKNLKLAYTAKSHSGMEGAYVFNNPEGGYAILAADDVAFPVLGYSDNGTIDVNNMSPEMLWWLSEYARQIEWAVENNMQPAKAPAANASWTAIPIQVKTKWDQSTPYNDMCPVYNGQLTVTGCVATSMAQVMNYHKYPEVGQGIKQYQCKSIGKKLTLNFAQRAFDWNNMLNSYPSGDYTDDQAAAVAYLMKACGYSVEMSYGVDASGAAGSTIGDALVQYFKYDEGTISLQRITYSGSQWAQMVYDNLKNIGPLVINGQAPLEGGHSFVCDGYDGKGYFHFNWGWSGMSDGYYALDALNPDAQGIGGMSGGFNFSQNAIFGIQPPTGQAANIQPDCVLQYGSTTATVNGNTINFGVKDYNPLGWGNNTTHAINMNVGAIFTPIDGTTGNEVASKGQIGGYEDFSLSSAYSYYPASNVQFTTPIPTLSNGKYRVTVACRDTKMEDSQWIPMVVPYGCQNSCLLTVNNGNYTITELPMAQILISDLEVVSDLYATKNALMKAKFTNNSDLELSQGVCPRITNGSTSFVGESVIITLQPGETTEKEWVTKFYNPSTGSAGTVNATTNFTMTLYNPQTSLVYNGVSTQVTMAPNPGTATFKLTKYAIPDVEKVQLERNGVNYFSVSLVNDLTNIPFDFGYQITKGYFDGQIRLGIYEQDPTNPRAQVAVIDDIYSEMPFMMKGGSQEQHINIDLSQGEEDHLYFITGYYTIGNSMRSMGSLPFICNPVGVKGIFSDDDNDVQYYNLQGLRIENPAPGQIVIIKRNGKTQKTIWK